MELDNEREEAFARAIVRGLTNRDAAAAAGYSKKTASAAGARLRKNERVEQRIAELTAHAEAVAVLLEGDSEKSETELSGGGVGEVETNQPVEVKEEHPRKRAVTNGTTVELDGVTYSLTDPKDMLTLCMLGIITLTKAQLDSAKSLLPVTHAKVESGGKKGAEAARAQQAGGGRFQMQAPPSEPIQGVLIQ